nr:PREDICTED: APC membrane recruitment protein 2 [Equus przewalskii]
MGGHDVPSVTPPLQPCEIGATKPPPMEGEAEGGRGRARGLGASRVRGGPGAGAFLHQPCLVPPAGLGQQAPPRLLLLPSSPSTRPGDSERAPGQAPRGRPLEKLRTKHAPTGPAFSLLSEDPHRYGQFEKLRTKHAPTGPAFSLLSEYLHRYESGPLEEEELLVWRVVCSSRRPLRLQKRSPSCRTARPSAQEDQAPWPAPSAGEPGGGEPAPAEVRTRREAESPGVPHAESARGEDAAGHRRADTPGAPPELGAAEAQTAEDASRTGDVPIKTVPPVDSECGSGRASAVPDPSSVDPPSDPSADRICLMFSDVTSLKSFDSLTGCGDIIADQEDEAGPSCDKHAPGPGKPVLSKKNPSVVAYQGGGEEMASPDEVDDTYLQEFWDMLSQTEDQGQGPQEGAAKAAAAALETKVVPETSKDARCAEGAKDVSLVKRRRLNRIPIELQPKEEPQHPEKEQQEGVPNSDEGYWDSTTPGPEEDGTNSGKKAGIPRDSYSGDALYDLYADPDASPAALPANEETSCVSRLKPVSPGTITCPLRTPGSLLKDSKIPISIKHLANLPSSHPVVHQQPARSEMPRTKIPVSKVLVRRVSNRGLAGTTIRAAACHDSAKKL